MEELQQLQQALLNKDPDTLSHLLDPTGQSDEFESLSEWAQQNSGSLDQVGKKLCPSDRNTADLISTFLVFAKDFEFEGDALRNLNLMVDLFKVIDRLFTQPSSGYLISTLRLFTNQLINLALYAGRVNQDSHLVKAGEAARMLARPIGVATNDRSQESPSKSAAIFFLANATFKVYFALRNLRLCDTVLNSTQSATVNLQSYPKADQVTFSYYRGRVFLYQRRLVAARKELQNAFNLCTTANPHNARLIFIYLITASLPLGIFPTDAALMEFELYDQYSDLIQSLRVGNFVEMLKALDEWKDWHKKFGNYLLLKEKLEVICWRNLIRRTLFVVTNGQPLPPTGPPSLSLHELLITARVAFGDQSLDIDDVESMCASLMEQGFIKAYIIHSKRLLVLQKGQFVGFPIISSIRP